MTIEEMSESFGSIVFNVGSVRPNSSTPFKFEYNGNVPIWGVTAACGCTAVEVIDGGVVGTYNASSSPGVVDKKITVYFDDGEDMYIRNDKKIATINPLSFL